MPNLTVAAKAKLGATQSAVRVVLVVAVMSSAASASHAGFYDPRQPTTPLASKSGAVTPLPFELLKQHLDDLIRAGDPQLPSELRTQFVERRRVLLDRGPRSLTGDELAELGLIQYRLRDPDKARETLSSAERRDPRNYWVYANLGSVDQATGQYLDALNHLQTAPSFFPTPWPVNPALGAWFKRCEAMQFQLLRSRLKEGFGRPGVRPPPPNDVDNLFAGVRFVGPNGQYVAGEIDAAEKAKLPPDAIAVVQQLLLWFPEDSRLFWLLGELYNAAGDLDSASAIFGECVWGRRFNAQSLREHRQIVKEAIEARVPATVVEPMLPEGQRLWAVVAGAGALFALFGYWQVRELIRRLRG